MQSLQDWLGLCTVCEECTQTHLDSTQSIWSAHRLAQTPLSSCRVHKDWGSVNYCDDSEVQRVEAWMKQRVEGKVGMGQCDG
jgi:hypothetical protein